MAFQLSPGVSITEKDVTLIVPAVATTGGGIVSPFAWGPAEQVVVISSEKELVNVFGAPIDTDYAAKWWYSAANFLAYGNNLKVVRFVTATDLNSTSSGTGIQVTNLDDYNGATLTSSGTWVAKYPGTLGDSLKVVILDYYSGDPDNSDGTASSDDYADWLRNFDDIPGTSTWAVNQGNSSAKDEIHILVIDEDGKFTGEKNTVLERFAFVSKAPNALKEDGTTNYYKNVINNESQYIWWANHPTAVQASGTSWGGDLPTSGSYKLLNGGFINRSSLTGGGVTTWSSSNDSAIAAAFEDYFGDADTVDVSILICGPLGATAADDVIEVAEARKDCIAFVSANTVSATSTTQTNLDNALTYRTSLTASSYGVLDSGTKFQYDRYNDKYRYIPLCGDIAGCCVRTDLNNDPWYSPAGFDRGRVLNAIKLAYNPNKTHRDELYKKGINPVVQFDGSGVILFGDKTLLQKPSAFDRINVRRLFIVLEKAIATAARNLLFEFNDEFTRSQFKLLVEPFLREVQGRRGLTDFRVVCDETNNTPQVIDSNNFVADIYIKPNRSINFIQLNFIATPTGLSFEEVVGA